MKINFLIGSLFLSVCLFAQGNNSGLKFLSTQESRVTSLGEAYIISSAGASATIGNPASMNLAPTSELQLGVMKYFQDINSQYLLGSYKSSENLSFGFHLLNYKVSGIEIREIPGESQGEFSTQYLSTGLSGALKITDKMNAGLTLKFLYEKIFIDDASGFAADLGFNYILNENILLGGAVSNLGSMGNLRNEPTDLPVIFGVGCQYKFDLSFLKNSAFVEFRNNVKDKKSHFTAAFETEYDEMLYLRLGYMTGYDSKNFTCGLGFQYWDVNLNYSFVPYSYNLGDHHSLSIKFKI